MHRLPILIACWLGAVAMPVRGAPPTSPLYKAARRAAERGEHTKAVELYRAAIDRADPDTVHPQILVGLLDSCHTLIDRERFAPAVSGLLSLLPATRDRPGRPSRLPRLAAAVRNTLDRLAFDLVMAGEGPLAVRALEARMAEDSGPPMRWALLARAQLAQGQFDQATETLRLGLQRHPAAPELLFVRAALAGALSERAVVQARYRAAENMLRHAARDLEQAIGAEQPTPGLHRALGRIRGSLWIYYRATGQPRAAARLLQQAEAAYERAAMLDPANPEPLDDLAELLWNAGDWTWSAAVSQRALRRYRRLALRPQRGPDLAHETAAAMRACRRRIARCHIRRGLAAFNSAHFEQAAARVRRAAHTAPEMQPRIEDLLDAMERRRLERARRLAALQRQADRPAALEQLAAIWLSEGRYAQARAALRRALDLSREPARRRRLGHKIKDLGAGTTEALELRFSLGRLDVRVELPADLDPADLHTTLIKAHALTSGLFAHQLLEPLWLKIFATRRGFLERAGIAVPPHQQAFYSLGRIVTYASGDRSRAEWLRILIHEIVHRYVDELTYRRAPRWLNEGLAACLAEPWDAAHRKRLAVLVRNGNLRPWSELENAFSAWQLAPSQLSALYLQSHAAVAHLMRRFGRERMITLLALLRQGSDIEDAAQTVFDSSLDAIYQRWRRQMS